MKKMRFVFCCFMTIVFMVSVALAEEKLFWRKVEKNGTVTYSAGYQNSQSWTFVLLSDGEDWYLKYRTGDAVKLTDMELQYQLDYTQPQKGGTWYVSSKAMQRAVAEYEKLENNSIYESDFILVENTGTVFELEDGSTYILKAQYQAENLFNSEVGFGIAVIFEGDNTPKFWVSLSKEECNIENTESGVQVYVSKLTVERAIKSYKEFSKFH